jgi:serine protease
MTMRISTHAWAVFLLTLGGLMPGLEARAASEAPAFGLIVGLRPDAESVADAAAPPAPGASSREARQARAVRQFRVGRERATQVVREAGLTVRGLGSLGDAQVLRFERPLSGVPLQDAMRRARLHPDVLWVEPDVLLRRQQSTVPNDPEWPMQWALGLPSVTPAAIHLPPAWSLTTGTSSVHMAVLDTGILPHPDLAGRVLPGYDFVQEVAFAADGDGRDSDPTDPGDWVMRTGNDPAIQQLVDAGLCGDFTRSERLDPSSWHGTFIAGQLGAATNNALGIAGVTWSGGVLPVRVSGKCGAVLSDLLDGMRWAAGLPVEDAPSNPHPARVINLSFGGSEPCSRSTAYQSAIDAVTAAGALVVVAAGNEARQLSRPADCRNVLTVGAVRRDGLKTDYSSYGMRVALMAPGGSTEGGNASLLLSTHNSGQTTAVPAENHYGYRQGTSFSAPWAAGVAALMLSVNPQLTPLQLIDRLRLGVRRWEELGLTGPPCNNQLASQGVCTCTADTCGTGLLDAPRALQLALGPAVVLLPQGPVTPGATVALDGAGSIAIPGAQIVGYRWRQLEGPVLVPIRNDTQAVAAATLPGAGTYVFELTVTDQQGRTGRDQVHVVAAAPSAGGGGGSFGLAAGLALWLWVFALGLPRLRRASGKRGPR